MKAMQITRLGGPDVFEEIDAPTLHVGPEDILVHHEAIGLNFIDIYRRTGVYPITLPAILGSEAAGMVTAVGDAVTRFKVGDHVGYATGLGAYAQEGVVRAAQAVKIPVGVSTRTAAAVLLKGMTAEFLTRIWPLDPGDPVLVHAAAGGVGVLLTQWLKHLGCTVIGTVGTPAKAETARANGCDHVILYDHEGVAKTVLQITAGKGAKVVYDSVGAATFEASLGSVAKRGLFVSFGNASGPVPAFAPLRLAQAGSIFMTRPTLFDYIATVEALDRAADALFAVIQSGDVKVDIGQDWPLSQVAAAHRALASRETTGASVLIP